MFLCTALPVCNKRILLIMKSLKTNQLHQDVPQQQQIFEQLRQVRHQGKREHIPKGLKCLVLYGIFSHYFKAHPVSPCHKSAHKSLNNLHSCVPCRGIKIAHKASPEAFGDSERVTLLPIIWTLKVVWEELLVQKLPNVHKQSIKDSAKLIQ